MRIAFDVDDTLWKVVRTPEGDTVGRQVPDYDLIAVLRWFKSNGDEVFVWSAGGVDYAQQIVDKLGLTDMCTVIPKRDIVHMEPGKFIDIAFDDMPDVALGKVNVHVKRPAVND